MAADTRSGRGLAAAAALGAFPIAVGVALGTMLLGCAGTFEMLGAALAYEEAPLSPERMELDVPYREGPDADPEKHRLDVFLPSDSDDQGEPESGWPTLVFVHGGGWTSGDRAMGGFGIDPIRNIGRFLAARGWGVVLPSYRLQPGSTWREQIADVAAATAWARREIGRYGGDPEAIHLGGHSAGAWLVAWVGLDDRALAAQGLDRGLVCSLVLVSGAGYDLVDERTYALGASRDFFAARFATDDADRRPAAAAVGDPEDGAGWARTASIRFHVDRPVPPVLVLTADGEPAKIRHQSDLLFETLDADGVDVVRGRVPGQDHQRILVGLSLSNDPASESLLGFLESRRCSGTRAPSGFASDAAMEPGSADPLEVLVEDE